MVVGGAVMLVYVIELQAVTEVTVPFAAMPLARSFTIANAAVSVAPVS